MIYRAVIKTSHGPSVFRACKYKISNPLLHGRRKVHNYFLLLLCKSSIWFTEQHIFKIIINFLTTLICAANYVIWFEVYDGLIGQKILKLWRQESWPFGPGWSANTLKDLPSSVFSRDKYCKKYFRPLDKGFQIYLIRGKGDFKKMKEIKIASGWVKYAILLCWFSKSHRRILNFLNVYKTLLHQFKYFW